jgi:hypothetical protein
MNPRKFGMLVLLAIITVCWWYLAGPRGPVEGQSGQTGTKDATPPALIPPDANPPPPPVADTAPSVRTRALPNPEGTDPIIPSIPLETGKLPWEKTIEQIEEAKVSDAEKGRRLLETLPTMPVDARETAAERAVALLPNADYCSAARWVCSSGT